MELLAPSCATASSPSSRHLRPLKEHMKAVQLQTPNLPTHSRPPPAASTSTLTTTPPPAAHALSADCNDQVAATVAGKIRNPACVTILSLMRTIKSQVGNSAS